MSVHAIPYIGVRYEYGCFSLGARNQVSLALKSAKVRICSGVCNIELAR